MCFDKFKEYSVKSNCLAWYAGEGEADPPTTPEPLTIDKITTEFESDSDEVVQLTQKELSSLMGKTRQKFRDQALSATKQVTALTEKLNLTDAERKKLDESIGHVRASLQSEVEKKSTEFETYKQQAEQQMKALKDQLAGVTNEFHSTLIETEITKACSEAGVVKPKQMLAYLQPKLKVVPDLDKSGKPTGKTKVAVLDKNDDGEDVSYGVLDFIKKLDEAGTDANLFAHSMKAGLGGNNGNGSSKAGDIPKDPKELAAWLAKPENREAMKKMPVNRS